MDQNEKQIRTTLPVSAEKRWHYIVGTQKMKLKTEMDQFIAAFPLLYDASRRSEVEGRFSREEVLALAAAHNSMKPTPELQFQASVLVQEMGDFERFENGISRYEANPKVLIDRLMKLSPMATYIVVQECVWWWRYDAENDCDYKLLMHRFGVRTESESQDA